MKEERRVEMIIDRKVIEDVLTKYGKGQVNLESQAAVKQIAKDIEKEILLKGLRHDRYWQ
tara:strand:+ start:745 stop:924 length:180 start_codon:yes stop_codon:yes gene_type:complete